MGFHRDVWYVYDAKYLRLERLEVAGKSFGESAEYPIFFGRIPQSGPKKPL